MNTFVHIKLKISKLCHLYTAEIEVFIELK